MKKYIIKVNGVSYDVEVEEQPSAGAYNAVGAAVAAPVFVTAKTPAAPPAAAIAPAAAAAPATLPAPVITPPAPPVPAPTSAAAAASVTAPMPGAIIRVLVGAGDSVKLNQPVILLEAMKMENEIVSPVNGTVLAVHTAQGASVNTGDLLVSIG